MRRAGFLLPTPPAATRGYYTVQWAWLSQEDCFWPNDGLPGGSGGEIRYRDLKGWVRRLGSHHWQPGETPHTGSRNVSRAVESLEMEIDLSGRAAFSPKGIENSEGAHVSDTEESIDQSLSRCHRVGHLRPSWVPFLHCVQLGSSTRRDLCGRSPLHYGTLL